MIVKMSPAEFAQKMYGIMMGQGLTHEQALFRAVCIACDEQRARCAERCEATAEQFDAEGKAKPHAASIFANLSEGARKAADDIRFHMSPSNLCSDGILR